jgi:hypothetical protein
MADYIRPALAVSQARKHAAARPPRPQTELAHIPLSDRAPLLAEKIVGAALGQQTDNHPNQDTTRWWSRLTRSSNSHKLARAGVRS